MAIIKDMYKVIEKLKVEVREMEFIIKDYKPKCLNEARWKRDIKDIIKRKKYIIENGGFVITKVEYNEY